jgi:hypothetical protein
MLRAGSKPPTPPPGSPLTPTPLKSEAASTAVPEQSLGASAVGGTPHLGAKGRESAARQRIQQSAAQGVQASASVVPVAEAVPSASTKMLRAQRDHHSEAVHNAKTAVKKAILGYRNADYPVQGRDTVLSALHAENSEVFGRFIQLAVRELRLDLVDAQAETSFEHMQAHAGYQGTLSDFQCEARVLADQTPEHVGLLGLTTTDIPYPSALSRVAHSPSTPDNVAKLHLGLIRDAGVKVDGKSIRDHLVEWLPLKNLMSQSNPHTQELFVALGIPPTDPVREPLDAVDALLQKCVEKTVA